MSHLHFNENWKSVLVLFLGFKINLNISQNITHSERECEISMDLYLSLSLCFLLKKNCLKMFSQYLQGYYQKGGDTKIFLHIVKNQKRLWILLQTYPPTLSLLACLGLLWFLKIIKSMVWEFNFINQILVISM